LRRRSDDAEAALQSRAEDGRQTSLLRQTQLKIRAVGEGHDLDGLIRLEERKRHEDEESQDKRTRLFECVLMPFECAMLTHW
jgi:hypothetical protein